MAHGLVLQLKEMLQRNLVNQKEPYEVFSEEDKIIKSWIRASGHPKFIKLEFYCLLRKTLLFILSPLSVREARKNELLKAVNIYFSKFPNMPKICQQLYKPLIDVILEPWRNIFLWDEFFQMKISFTNKNVQDYFASEPEEIVTARIHCLIRQDKEEMAMVLAKNSFLYHSRVSKSFSAFKSLHRSGQCSQSVLSSNKCRPGTASLDWYLFILQKQKSLPFIVKEMEQLTCHEGVHLIQRLRKNKNQKFAFTLLQILLLQILVKSSTYCCTKKIFSLWSLMHKEKNTDVSEINSSVRKILATHAPSSAHFYLFVDALWEQFGSRLMTIYIELYVRGLTVDVNYLEVAKYGEVAGVDIDYLENHIASMFSKLSTLFSDFHEAAARECMFSAFSLKPTKERLYILQSLTHSILSSENEMKLNSSLNNLSQECKCDIRCNGSCKSIKEYYLDHPILKKGIPGVPFHMVKDLVSVLESVRCTRFQYNIFDWHNNATDLGDYLKDFVLLRRWEPSTNYVKKISSVNDIDDKISKNLHYPSPVTDKPFLTTKRKSESEIPIKEFSSGMEANKINNNENLSKKIKMLDQKPVNKINTDEFFNRKVDPVSPLPNFNSFSMKDAIENVVRLTLDSKQRSDSNYNNNYLGTSLSYTNDGTEKLTLSSLNKPSSENHVFPYSLTAHGENSNKSSNFQNSENETSVKSDARHINKFISYAPKSSKEHHPYSSFVPRENILSPTPKYRDEFPTSEQSNKVSSHMNITNKISQAQQSSFSGNAINLTNRSNTNITVPTYQQNLVSCQSSVNTYEQIKSVQNVVAKNFETKTAKITAKETANPISSISPDSSKVQFSPKSISSNLDNQSNKIEILNHTTLASTLQTPSGSLIYKSGTKFQSNKEINVTPAVVKRTGQNISSRDNQIEHHDRSSVIRHTMQKVHFSTDQEVTEKLIPNQFSVSLKSNDVEQIRNIPSKDIIKNLPPFTVTVPDKTISNSPLAVPASLVITRKPLQTEAASQLVCNSTTDSTNKDTITIPGILASPSVIVTPWETQHKTHGKLMYKKNSNVNASNVEKKIYKYRTPYPKHLIIKSDSKVIQQATPATKSHLLKALTSASPNNPKLIPVPNTNQNNCSSSQVWLDTNKSASSSLPSTSQSASSQPQPWYSEPYPKPPTKENPQSTANSNIAMKQKLISTDSFQPVTNIKNYSTYKHPRQIHTEKLPLTTGISHLLNATPEPAKLPVNNVDVSSSTNVISSVNVISHTTRKQFLPESTSIVSSSSQAHIIARAFSPQSSHINHHPQPSNSLVSKSQYKTVPHHSENPTAYATAAVADSKLCHILTNKFPASCCSPSEVNPCQNCSLPSEKKFDPTSTSNQFPASLNSRQAVQNNKKMVSDDVLLSDCDAGIMNDINASPDLMFSNMNESYSTCPYCSNSILESELELHVLSNHTKEYDTKSTVYNSVESNEIFPRNVCLTSGALPASSLEPEPLYQKESFETNILQARTNSVENQNTVSKNFDDIEENAFNACMDLINSDKDLKRMVQDIDSMEQIENKYVPFTLNVPENSMQNISEIDQSNEDKKYTTNFNYPQSDRNEMNLIKPLNEVFNISEKNYEDSKLFQNLTNASSYLNNMPVNNSKESDALSFSALSEMIKVAIDDSNNVSIDNSNNIAFDSCDKNVIDNTDNISIADSNNEGKNVENYMSTNENNSVPLVSSPKPFASKPFGCTFCKKSLKSSMSLKRHILKIHPHISVENLQEILNRKVDKSASLYVESPNLNPLNCISLTNSSEINTRLPKGKIKGIIKYPTSQCRFCGKVLSTIYLKTHIRNQHKEIDDILKSMKNKNAKVKNSNDINTDKYTNLEAYFDSSDFTSPSNLPDQDIDSSTCLSVSDALKINQSCTDSSSHAYIKTSNNAGLSFNSEFSKNDGIDVSKDDKTQSTNVNANAVESNKVNERNIRIDQNCYIREKYECYVCKKTYTAVSSVNKHLKTVHGVTDIPRRPRKNSRKRQIDGNVKNASENDIVGYPYSHESQKVLHSKTNMQCSEEMSYTTKPITREQPLNFIPKKLGRPKKSLLHGNLLKKVLKSNFVSKRKLENDLKSECKTDLIAENKFLENPAVIQQSDTDHLHSFKKSNYQNQYETSNVFDSTAQSTSEITDSVPLQERGLKDCSVLFKDDASSYGKLNVQRNCTQPENNLKLQTTHLNNKSSDLHASQNLNTEVSEMSAVSEIFSNISKFQFMTSPNDNFDDNSLKLVIPNENQCVDNNKVIESDVACKSEMFDNMDKHCITPWNDESSFEQELSSVDVTLSSDNSFSKSSNNIERDFSFKTGSLNDNLIKIELTEQNVECCNLDKNSDLVCRICKQNLSSSDCLSQHLKSVHNIPLLKKPVSQSICATADQSAETPEKLSPPKLKLGTNDSDSESISDYDNINQNSIKTSNEDFESEISQSEETKMLESDLSSSSFSESSQKEMSSGRLTCKIKLSALDRPITSSNSKFSNSSFSQSSNSNSSIQPKKTHTGSASSLKHRKRCHSFSDAKSFFIAVKRSNSSSYSKPLRYSLCGRIEKKSASLPNIKHFFQNMKSESKRRSSTDFHSTKKTIMLSYNCSPKFSDKNTESTSTVAEDSTSCSSVTDVGEEIKITHNSSKNNLVHNILNSKENSRIPSLEHSTCCSSVTDVSEEIKITYDSSKNNLIHDVSNSKENSIKRVPSLRLKMKSKLSNRKLAKKYNSYKRDKRLKNKVTSKYLKKYKSRKTYKPRKSYKLRKTYSPFILTLSEKCEISEFLKNHKQPTVKLTRLSENEIKVCNKDDESTLHANSKHDVKQVVVKLERMPISKTFEELIIFDQNIPNVLSHDKHFNSMQNFETQSEIYAIDAHVNLSDGDLSHSHILEIVDNVEMLNVKDCDSDTVVDEQDSKLSLTGEESCLNEECIFPLKRCSVILKRISV